MSAEIDLKLSYQIGYDDALAGRKPDSSKALVLKPGPAYIVPYNENYATCSVCGVSLPRAHGGWWFYCPGCGRQLMGEKVVDE